MIHVCSLSRLHATVDETGARHIVTLLRLVDRVQRPAHIAPEESSGARGRRHHGTDGWLCGTGARARAAAHRFRHGLGSQSADGGALLRRNQPLDGGAYVAACALNPNGDEMQIAWTYWRIAHGATECADRFELPTVFSNGTAAWYGRSMRSASVMQPPKAILSA